MKLLSVEHSDICCGKRLLSYSFLKFPILRTVLVSFLLFFKLMTRVVVESSDFPILVPDDHQMGSL